MRRNVKKTEGKGRVKKKLEKKMTKLNERNRKKQKGKIRGIFKWMDRKEREE